MRGHARSHAREATRIGLWDWITGRGRKAATSRRSGKSLGGGGQRGSSSGTVLTSEDVEGFLHDGELLVVGSSNVGSATYSEPDGKLVIEYLDGSVWAYSPVSTDLALSFAQAPSKGTWVWDHLKVRGTRHDHQPGITAEQSRGGGKSPAWGATPAVGKHRNRKKWQSP